MTTITQCFIFLADRSHWERLGDGVSGKNAQLSGNEMLGLLGFVAAVVLLIIWLHEISRRQDSKRTYNKPKKLLAQLCDAHQLHVGDRKLLSRLATARRLTHPAEIFLCPEAFTLETLPDDLSRDADRIITLRSRLFE